MKCKHCGAEITDDSVFCEHCGTRVSKSNSKFGKGLAVGVCVTLLVLIALVAIGGPVMRDYWCSSISEEVESTSYTDLGLPSGTLWKTSNEENTADTKYDFFTYDEAVSKFGERLPTKEQWEELKDECHWSWTGSGYKVTGSNGNSIILPASGYRYCYGSANGVGSNGRYWSSTPQSSDDAWRISFYEGNVDVDNNYRCLVQSVRLVQSSQEGTKQKIKK